MTTGQILLEVFSDDENKYWDLELPVSQSLVMGGSVMNHTRV